MFGMTGSFKVGDVFGVAVDLDQGRMAVSLNGDFDNPSGGVPFENGVLPGPVTGGGIFPAFAGCNGVKIAYNFGFDQTLRPLRFSPPGPEYKAAALISENCGYAKKVLVTPLQNGR